MDRDPLVEVIMSTYNHAKFIAQAIESVLSQKTDFDYRLVIVDDCSTDGTAEIVAEYAARHPSLIEAALSPKRVGILTTERLSLRRLERSKAKYIALLEGDDYWTNPEKLRRQVDFLETHHEYAISFHNALVVNEDGSEPPYTMCRADQKETSTIEDLLEGNFIPTCSVVFRGGLLGRLPDWVYELQVGDWPLHVLNAQHGKVGYMKDVMATYRIHQQGYWGARPYLARLEYDMQVYKALRRHFRGKYRADINRAMSGRFMIITEKCEESGQTAKARHYALLWFFGRLRCGEIPDRYITLKVLRLFFPALYLPLRGLKRKLIRRLNGA